MIIDENVEQFYHDLNQEVIAKSASEDEENYRENVFTEIYIDDLVEGAEIGDGNVCYYEAKGLKINGFSLSDEDESTMTLFVSIYRNNPELYSVAPADAKAMLDRLKQFFISSLHGYHTKMEEAFPAYDISKSIYELRQKIEVVNLYLFTNGTVRSMPLDAEETEGVKFCRNVWDVQRIFRLVTSGNAREDIEIHLADMNSDGLDCVYVSTPGVKRTNKEGDEYTSGAYTSYFTAISGETLYQIYDKFNARLLEKNVRAFLQAKGNVNKGIKNTINSIPEMFLAYNNGISATASEVIVKDKTAHTCVITDLKDFQIVNGGQTTASIFYACVKNKEPLDKINIQTKITVLADAEAMKDVVPNISLYANSQNKVQLADFSANDEFHQKIENLSRTVWAPAKTNGEQQTKWFYERARGQYADERFRARSIKIFDAIYPKEQYFDKLQLARYINLWEQKPYIASKGGQANFREFTVSLGKNVIPDQKYYENLIAMAILYKAIRKLVKQAGFEAYWSNIIDYTMSLFSHAAGSVLNFQAIWKAQAVPECILSDCESIAKAFNDYLLNSAGSKNVTQWCKQKECWEGALRLDIRLSPVTSEYVEIDHISSNPSPVQPMISANQQSLIDDLKIIESETWWTIAKWGKETGILPSYQNGIAGTLAKYKNWKKDASYKQALQGLKILNSAYEHGYVTDDSVKSILDKYRSEL